MKIKEIILYTSAALFVGLTAGFFWTTESGEEKYERSGVTERVSEPEQKNGGTDEFSLRVLQAALESVPGSNVLVAPNSLAALLKRLQDMSGGAAKDALDALHLPKELALTSVDLRELALLFPDTTIPLSHEHQWAGDIVPVPYKQSITEAFIAINKTVALYSENVLERTAGSETVGTGTEFACFNGIVFQEEWIYPVDDNDTVHADFFNGNGAMPSVPLMKHRGEFRVAKAANGDWEAVALFFRNILPNRDSACMVAILPKESSARSFVARKLTPAMLNEIRLALYQAKPIPCTIEIPRLVYRPPVQDSHPLLSQLGLGSLFMQEAPFPGLTKQTPFHLDCSLQQMRVTLAESPAGLPLKDKEEKDDASHPIELRFDRPFVWYIGDLTSARPFHLMGIVENL